MPQTHTQRPQPATRRRPAAPDVPVVEFEEVEQGLRWRVRRVLGGDVASMRIGRGEFVFLVGPTGCGKSTCIRLLAQGARGRAKGRDQHRRPLDFDGISPAAA